MKAIIIDDEKNCSDVLQIQLKSLCPQIEIIAVHNDSLKGIESVQSLNPDVLFLDVEMPRANGFEVLQRLQPINFEVIFTTAHESYAIQAIRFSALDYLTKPIQDNELVQAVSRLKEKKAQSQITSQLDLLLNHIQKPNQSLERIALATSEGIEIIDVQSILYCEAQSNYTLVHFTNRKKLLVSKTLKQIDELLKPHLFYRVHQSYLVNLKFAKKYVRSDGGYLIMEGSIPVSVAQSRRDALIRKLQGK